MLKLFSQLPLGVSFSDIFGGGRQWKKVDANDAIDVEGVASERKSFDQLDICSIGPGMQADFLAMQAQMNAVRGAPDAIDADDDFVDMARALREGRLYALDPHDPSREFSFVVAAHEIHPQHVDASAWVVDALGRKEPASCPMPVGVWRSEFSDLVFVPEADALIKALYDEQGAFARNDAMGERAMEKVSLDENTQMRRLLADLADYAENATLEGDELPSSVNDARALLSTPSEKSRVAACLLFNEELLEQYEVLGDIAYQYNVRTLTDIMHLQTAILEGTHIDAWVEQSSVLEVLAGLPSGQAWISTYTSEFVNDECVRDAAILKQQERSLHFGSSAGFSVAPSTPYASFAEATQRDDAHQEVTGAIERVIDRRHARGASDAAIVGYLQGLKGVWKDPKMHRTLDALISGVKASPAVAALVGIEFEQELRGVDDSPSP